MNIRSRLASENDGIPASGADHPRARILPRILGALVYVATIWIAPAAPAQQFESATLLAPELTSNVWFGLDVAISGPWALVGDLAAGTAGTKGEAYFYRRDPGGWTLKQSVRGTQSSRLGDGVALDGDTAVIGIPTWDWLHTRTGKALVYEREGDAWVRVQGLLPPGLKWTDLFGQGVGVSGDVIVVGAPGVDRNVPNSGKLFVYERQAGIWVLVDTFVLPRNKKTLGFQAVLGRSIAVDGDCFVAGAPGPWGAAYVYERDAGGWSQVAVLEDLTPKSTDAFGASVAICGDTIVVGEPAPGPASGGSHRAGSAFVYERDAGGTWILVRELQASDGFGGLDIGSQFGSAVAVEDNRIVVGALNAENPAKNDGKGYLFERGPSGTWPATETLQLLASNPSSPLQDSTGSAAAMDDGFIFLGAPTSKRGRVYIFELELGTPYCFPGNNSTGEPARLTVTGSEVASKQILTLSVRDCPSDTPGLFLLSSGRETQLIPDGNGLLSLCLGPEIGRLSPAARTGPGGVAFHTLDFGERVIGGSLLAGTTWYFQFAYRDGPSAGAGFNLSNAVALTLE